MEKEIIRFNKEGLPIRIQQLTMRRDASYRGMHSHPAVEIVTVKRGSLYCDAGDGRLLVRENEILLINGNISHALSSNDAQIVYMQIDISSYKVDSSLGEFAALYEFISRSQAKPYLVLANDGELGEILQKIQRRYYEDRKESRWYLKAHIYELVAFLFAQAFIQPQPCIKSEKIQAIVRYIDDHFTQPITLDDICAGVGYNKYALCHAFKAVTEQTVFDYINFRRIQTAVKSLAEQKQTITEIAAACGFSSVAYFNRVFKSVMGCTPSQYRKTNTPL